MNDELFDFVGTWHVRHADGTEEDIVLDHGNLVEDSRGTAGQFLLRRQPAVPKHIRKVLGELVIDGHAYSDLIAHLISEHANAGALGLTQAEAVKEHSHEHLGPGTIRNHDASSREWSLAKVAQVLSERED